MQLAARRWSLGHLANWDRLRFKEALWLGPEVDFYYMRNRRYEPQTGRFLSEDPIGLDGGSNLYAFAGNVEASDPEGLRPCKPGEEGHEDAYLVFAGDEVVGSGVHYHRCSGRLASALADGGIGWPRSFSWGGGARAVSLPARAAPSARDTPCSALASPLLGNWKISSGFKASREYRTSPHRGIDYSVPVGTPVYAMAGGTVYQAGYHESAGERVGIEHPGGLFSRYLHLSKIFVSAGGRVTTMTAIGLSGASGKATGPHLHVEVFRDFNNPLNPLGCF